MITQKAISEILRPLLVAGVYKDERVALKDIIAEFIQKKSTGYNTVIGRMEKKYGKDLQGFSKEIKNKAVMKTEDDWMEWKAAMTMKEAWQLAFRNLVGNSSKV